MYARWTEYSCPRCRRKFSQADLVHIHNTATCPGCHSPIRLDTRAALSQGFGGMVIALVAIGCVAALAGGLEEVLKGAPAVVQLIALVACVALAIGAVVVAHSLYQRLVLPDQASGSPAPPVSAGMGSERFRRGEHVVLLQGFDHPEGEIVAPTSNNRYIVRWHTGEVLAGRTTTVRASDLRRQEQ